MIWRFRKMQGLGNDFLVFDGVRQTIELSPARCRALADRHFGVGCDQILLVEKSTLPAADFRYRIFNADGSEVEQCGNGARCFARFVAEEGLSDKNPLAVETKKGLIYLTLEKNNEVTVDMGAPQFSGADFSPPTAQPVAVSPLGGQIWRLPLKRDHDQSADDKHVAKKKNRQPQALHALPLFLSYVSMGNPHAVLLVDDVTTAPVAAIGAALQQHRAFPQRVNVGFVQVMHQQHLKLRVYERGCGETLACGTGACAAAVTAMTHGLVISPVQVEMQGGSLSIRWNLKNPQSSVFMTGAAVTVFSGEVAVDTLPL